MKSRLGVVFMLVGVMLAGAGLAYGFAGVNVIKGESCGNAFSEANSSAFTDTGDEACAVARSERKPWAYALITAGVLGFVIGGFVAGFDAQDANARERDARERADEGEPAE